MNYKIEKLDRKFGAGCTDEKMLTDGTTGAYDETEDAGEIPSRGGPGATAGGLPLNPAVALVRPFPYGKAAILFGAFLAGWNFHEIAKWGAAR